MSGEEEWVVIGRITAPHGIRGELKLAPFVDDLSFVRDLETLYVEGRPRRAYRLVGSRPHKSALLVRFEGIESRNDAERLRGRQVSVPGSWLPPLDEDEYYVRDIVGLEAVTEEGEPLGRIADVLFTGANEVYIVRDGPKGEILIPAIESVVLAVDLNAGQLTVRLPDGLVD